MRAHKTPNFIIGGTAAGGTSFLSAILVQHPQVYLPKQMRPEPHYFYKSWEYEKGDQYYHSRWFANVPATALAVGERSSSYLFGGKEVARKIAKYNADMKFIFTLRNPIERTWANYRYTALQGLEDLSFEEALSSESKRVKESKGIWAEIQPYNYTGRGLYAAQLLQYLECFPAENILTVKSELLSLQTDVELHKICRFLGVSGDSFTYRRAPDHTSVNIRDVRLQKNLRNYFGDRFDLIIEACRKDQDLSGFATCEDDRHQIQLLIGNMSGTKAAISEQARALLHQVFAQDIDELSKHVDFDISDWK